MGTGGWSGPVHCKTCNALILAAAGDFSLQARLAEGAQVRKDFDCENVPNFVTNWAVTLEGLMKEEEDGRNLSETRKAGG